MNSTRYITTILTGILLCLSGAVNGQLDERPNIIFIICDDLNDYEGVFGGHPQAITPNMDALAASGVQFLNAASNAPVCMPSRNSIFTGVYPHDSKDFGWTGRTKHPVLKNNKPFIQMLRENGYYTAGSGKLLHEHEPSLWDSWGMNKKYNYGPLYYDGTSTGAHPAVPAPYREIGAIDGSYGSFATAGGSPGVQGEPGFVYGQDLKPFRYVTDNDRDLMQDELHAQWAVGKLQQWESEGLNSPFFLGLGFVKPHTPLHAPQKYYDMYPLDELELADWLEGDEKDTYYRDLFSEDTKGLRYFRTILESYGGDRELALKKFLQAYLACVSFVDEQIGTVLEGLENSAFSDNTIVILTSDHGWQMGEKQYLFKNSAWEESVRVPLVIRTADSTPGSKVEHPISLVDIYPTIMDYGQLIGNHTTSEVGAPLGGNSLRTFLENPLAESWEGPEGSLSIIGNTGVRSAVSDQNFSYRTRDWRYILYRDGSEELYDHRSDPNEWHNLAYVVEYLEIKKELKRQVLELVPMDTAAFFSDDFERYTPGEDVESMAPYNVWGQKSVITISNDATGHGAYSGEQFALANAFWGALVVPLALEAGRSYSWSVATKVETDKPDDNWKRRRGVTVKSVDYSYFYTEVDSTIDDWVVTESAFTIEQGYEDVTLQVIGNLNFEMGIDDFFLFESPQPRLKLYYDGQITEGEEDGEVITLVVQDDVFLEPLNVSSMTVLGLPEGVTAVNLQRIDSTMAQFRLSGSSLNSYNGKDIIGLTVTLEADQFKNSDLALEIYDDVVFSAQDTATGLHLEEIISPKFTIYPNPIRSSLYLELREPLSGALFLRIVDMQGRTVQTHAMDLMDGSIIYSMEIDPLLQDGLYLLMATSWSEQFSNRFFLERN